MSIRSQKKGDVRDEHTAENNLSFQTFNGFALSRHRCVLCIAIRLTCDTIFWRATVRRSEQPASKTMERQWEEFEHGPIQKHAERIHVSINPRGNLYLNRLAFEAMGKPESVVLLYDRRQSMIGLRAAPAGRENAFRLKRKDPGPSGNRVIYAANFCRFYHIKTAETLAFTTAEVDQQGVLILDLNKVEPVRRVRK